MKVDGTACRINFFNAASVLMYRVCSFPSAENCRLTSVICAPVAFAAWTGAIPGCTGAMKGTVARSK